MRQKQVKPPLATQLLSIARGSIVACAATLVAYALTQVFTPVALRSPFLLFVGAVMFSAWYVGAAAGMLACFLTILTECLLIFPDPRLVLTDPNYLVPLILFVVVAMLVTWLTEARRREGIRVRRQADLLDLSPDAIFTFGLDGAITFWSHGAESMYGRKREEVVGRPAHDLLRTEFTEPLSTIQAQLQREGSWTGDLYQTRADGARIAVNSRWLLRRGGHGEPAAVLETNIDITARRRVEEERERLFKEREDLLVRERAARREAEAAVRTREQFIALASHELRTPLTSIKGYAELLEQRAEAVHLDEPSRQMLGVIKGQTSRLEKMIAALLDISRLEKGRLDLECAPVELGALVRSALDDVRPTLRRHNVEFHGVEAPVVVQGDALRLEQVLQNLLQNAVKYSPLGGAVTVALSTENGMARIDVADYGIGIPKAEVPRIFSRFYRASNAEANHIGGLGIGLYVVGEIVRAHGGSVDVASDEGRGSTFSVHLPLVRA